MQQCDYRATPKAFGAALQKFLRPLALHSTCILPSPPPWFSVIPSEGQEWSEPGGRDIDGKAERPSERERTSQSLIVGFGFAVTIGHMKKIISTNEAPAAIGPYSQAVRSGNFLFCSGQIPLDPKSGQIVAGDISAQTRRVLDNIAAVLRAEGLSFDHVVKTTIFLTNLGDFQTVNEIYGSYFKQNPPARSTVQVAGLPKGANVEIEVIAVAEEAAQTAYDTSG
jgi:2-iminobutanoate/2-iminopropanoate deaminase